MAVCLVFGAPRASERELSSHRLYIYVCIPQRQERAQLAPENMSAHGGRGQQKLSRLPLFVGRRHTRRHDVQVLHREAVSLIELRATSPALSHRPRVALVSVGDGDHTDACTPLEPDTVCFSASPGPKSQL